MMNIYLVKVNNIHDYVKAIELLDLLKASLKVQRSEAERQQVQSLIDNIEEEIDYWAMCNPVF